MSREFLIKRTDGDWFSLKKSDFVDILKPSTISSKPVEGSGDLRISIPNGTIVFSYEDPGIQVVFENFNGTDQEALSIVKEILHSIQTRTKEQGEIVEL